MTKICFVICPPGEKYHVRYKSIYAPAIEAAGLTPVLGDVVGASSPDIKKKIKEAHICMADISEDNKVMWLAFGAKEEVVFVCHEECCGNVPPMLQEQDVLFFKDSNLKESKEKIGERLSITSKKVSPSSYKPLNKVNRVIKGAMKIGLVWRVLKWIGDLLG